MVSKYSGGEWCVICDTNSRNHTAAMRNPNKGSYCHKHLLLKISHYMLLSVLTSSTGKVCRVSRATAPLSLKKAHCCFTFFSVWGLKFECENIALSNIHHYLTYFSETRGKHPGSFNTQWWHVTFWIDYVLQVFSWYYWRKDDDTLTTNCDIKHPVCMNPNIHAWTPECITIVFVCDIQKCVESIYVSVCVRMCAITPVNS